MKHALSKVWIAAKSNKSIIFQKGKQATLSIWTLRIYLVIGNLGKNLDLIFVIKDKIQASFYLSRDKLIYNENKLASIFSDYFIIATSNLEVRNPRTKKLINI